MHTATGDFKDKKVVFGFEDVGHDGGPDEPDLARLNSGSNIDRGINTTGVTSSAASSTYDQFLEILQATIHLVGFMLISTVQTIRAKNSKTLLTPLVSI